MMQQVVNALVRDGAVQVRGFTPRYEVDGERFRKLAHARKRLRQLQAADPDGEYTIRAAQEHNARAAFRLAAEREYHAATGRGKFISMTQLGDTFFLNVS